MVQAMEEARRAIPEGEVPVGAVLVRDGMVVARARNRRETRGDPTAHAEMLLIRQAVEAASAGAGWRFLGATLYVTLEPCVMCMGAVVLARVPRLVFGCSDPKGGAARTLYQLGNDPRLNHRVEVVGGVLAEESGELLRGFFRSLRARARRGRPLTAPGPRIVSGALAPASALFETLGAALPDRGMRAPEEQDPNAEGWPSG